jgi:hypothetical protein
MERTGNPLDFSSFQMQTFLKASNFRCRRVHAQLMYQLSSVCVVHIMCLETNGFLR